MTTDMTEMERRCVDLMGVLMTNRPELVKQLSPATIEVCRLRAAGLDEKHIAELLGKSYHTVHDHVKAVYRRLGVRNNMELTLLFVMPRTTTGDTANA